MSCVWKLLITNLRRIFENANVETADKFCLLDNIWRDGLFFGRGLRWGWAGDALVWGSMRHVRKHG